MVRGLKELYHFPDSRDLLTSGHRFRRSDIAFLSWASVTSEQERRNLRFVVRRVIKNARTVDILRRMARDQGYADGRVPTKQAMAVGPDTKGWLALLASPNVSGVCWLLIQHQDELGPKVIKGIRVFDEYPTGKYAPTMAIEVGDRDASVGSLVGLSSSGRSKL